MNISKGDPSECFKASSSLRRANVINCSQKETIKKKPNNKGSNKRSRAKVKGFSRE
jgi:hypothetical protein